MAKQKSGAKGHGARAAKKASYQARKAGSSRKGKNRKQTGGTITMRNKAARAERHKKYLMKQQTAAEKRLEMLEQVKSQFSGKKMGELTSMFGTLNIRRMTDILAGTWEESEWYKARVAKKEAEKEAKRNKVGKKHVRFHKRKRDKKSGPVQKVSRGRDKGNRKVQVASQ